MNKLTIIKLGGSVITYKDSSVPKARVRTIKRLSKEIKQLLSSKKTQLIIVHGAGSFGHPLAKKYSLHKGMATELQKFQFGVINQQLIQLNSLVVNSLLSSFVSATSLPPRAFITTDAGKLKHLNCTIIKDLLKNEIIPVLFGDAVFDSQWGCSILSGDTVISYLAKELKADKVVFLSDVDGVFDKDPKKFTDTKLITEINNQNLDQILKGITQNNLNDVNGEMKHKILSVKESLPGVTVKIVSGLKPGRLSKILDSSHIGTTLSFE